MDIKEFAQQFQESVNIAVEMGNGDYDQELASAILEYLEDNGEVNVPEICSFQKTRTRITAYDYNDEAESLDLFYLVKAETLLGKVNNSKIQQGFNYLMSFYREAMNDTLFRTVSIEKNAGWKRFWQEPVTLFPTKSLLTLRKRQTNIR